MKEQESKDRIDWGNPPVFSLPRTENLSLTIVPGILAGIAFPQAKKEMVSIGKLLQTSSLDWTLVRFMAPKNAPYAGKVKVGFGDVKMKFSISRADIGAFMVEQVNSGCYIGLMPIIGS